MDIKLRQIRENDFIFAWQLYELLMKPLTEELLPWKEGSQKDVIRKAVQDARTRIILVDDEKAGWLQTDEADDHIYISQIYISPDLQGKGIGTLLIQNIIQQAKADGKVLKLSVMKNNLAKAFYERLGFKVAAEDQFKCHMIWQSF
jgi:ribosomal protein S18 acetylase RimI-like enzyme